MNIENNVLRHYLKNCYFINGTAYAGKSTACKSLADKYQMIHCEENYNSDVIFSVIDKEIQPNLSYFSTMSGWQEFINRTPQAYQGWMTGNRYELSSFEIAELIRLSADRKVIVDTNLPIEYLEEISDYSRVVIMLSPPEYSAKKFFDRPDKEKQFLLSQIQLAENPEKTEKNFRDCVLYGCKKEYDEYMKTDFFKIIRDSGEWLSQIETLEIIANHFKL